MYSEQNPPKYNQNPPKYIIDAPAIPFLMLALTCEFLSRVDIEVKVESEGEKLWKK